MEYHDFALILNKAIFDRDKIDLLEKVADRPNRFVGLFRPTKPGTKLVQSLLQSREIRFGDAMEKVIEEILHDFGYHILGKHILGTDGKSLKLDQYFTDNINYYLVEQKIRDDHDSSKREGQMRNFEKKIEALHKKHGSSLIGSMYFIDPDLTKNMNYYKSEIVRIKDIYNINIELFYGSALFNYLGQLPKWDELLLWLTEWKSTLSELPEINFDSDPVQTFEDIKELSLGHWKKIIQNEKLWSEGIIRSIFRDGSTLLLMLNYFRGIQTGPHRTLFPLLQEKMSIYYDYPL